MHANAHDNMTHMWKEPIYNAFEMLHILIH